MAVDPASYDDFEAEELSVLTVTGASRADVAAALEADRSGRPDGDPIEELEDAEWAFIEVDNAVVAVEFTGFADPTGETLASLSTGGRRVAVARSNILAHVRFGCARDGQLLFDDNEFAFTDDAAGVPPELADLMSAVRVDLDDQDADQDGPGWLSTALAMAETFTGVRVTAEMVGE